jgi:hypothetical protein
MPMMDSLASSPGGSSSSEHGQQDAPSSALHSSDYGAAALLTDIQGSEDHLGDMDFKASRETRMLLHRSRASLTGKHHTPAAAARAAH